MADLDAFRQRLIAAAIRAPSGDNCQPWIFEFVEEYRLLVSFSPELAESFFDFGHCGTYISLGAVAENLRIQASSDGFGTDVDYSDLGAHDPKVIVEFRPAMGQATSDSISRSVFQRTVNRRPFLPVRPSRAKLASLLRDPFPGVRVRVIENRREIFRWAAL